MPVVYVEAEDGETSVGDLKEGEYFTTRPGALFKVQNIVENSCSEPYSDVLLVAASDFDIHNSYIVRNYRYPHKMKVTKVPREEAAKVANPRRFAIMSKKKNKNNE